MLSLRTFSDECQCMCVCVCVCVYAACVRLFARRYNVSQPHYERARLNLIRMSVVGVYERFDETWAHYRIFWGSPRLVNRMVRACSLCCVFLFFCYSYVFPRTLSSCALTTLFPSCLPSVIRRWSTIIELQSQP
jgi:hypothetical protein